MKHILTDIVGEVDLREFVCGKLGIDAQLFMRLLDKGEIRLDGAKVRANCTIGKGVVVQVFLPQKFVVKKDFLLETIYDDDNIVIVKKPQGVDVIEFGELVQKEHIGALAVHRLDRNTGGLMIFGLNRKAEDALLDGFKNHSIRKTYQAKVFGLIEGEYTLKAWHFKDEKLATVFVYDTQRKGCKYIETKIKSLYTKEESTVLQVQPITGRTHQIRAHLCHIGHPIVGDGKYSLQKYKQAQAKHNVKYQQLFAVKLEFGAMGQPLGYLNGKIFDLGDIL